MWVSLIASEEADLSVQFDNRRLSVVGENVSSDFGTILIIDGDRAWVDDCASVLENQNYTTERAYSVAQAFDKIRNTAISTVIVDNRMPDGDGISLIHALSGHARLHGRRLSFILVTAFPTVDLAIEAIRACVVDLLQKPFTPAALNASIMRVRAMRADTASPEPFIHEVKDLRSELRRLVNLLQETSGDESAKTEGSLRKGKLLDATLVKKLIRAEYARARAIGGKILGDPAWNILLDLLLASLEGRRVAVSSACIVAGVATTTALRLVNRMVDDGVLIRLPDDNDGRRHFLAIAPEVEDALKNYLLDLANL
jgi:DNA-binding response OmpR family regulator